MRSLLTSVAGLLLGLCATLAQASDDDPLLCTAASLRTTSVAFTDGHTTPYDTAGSGGAPEGFDPVPLGRATVQVGGSQPSCLVAQLSVHALRGAGFGDDLAVYQVRVDGVPMIGHSTWCASSRGTNFACLPMDNTSPAGIAAHSYHLYLPVAAGRHEVEVLFGCCCSGKGAYSGGVLTLHHR